MSSRVINSLNTDISPITDTPPPYLNFVLRGGFSPSSYSSAAAFSSSPKYLLRGGGGGKTTTTSSSSSSSGSGGGRRRAFSPLSDVTNVKPAPPPHVIPVKVVDDDVFVMDGVLVGGGGATAHTPNSPLPFPLSPLGFTSCRAWKELGHCRYAPSSQYIHGKEDLCPISFPRETKEEVSPCKSVSGVKSIDGMKNCAPSPVTGRGPVPGTQTASSRCQFANSKTAMTTPPGYSGKDVLLSKKAACSPLSKTAEWLPPSEAAKCPPLSKTSECSPLSKTTECLLLSKTAECLGTKQKSIAMLPTLKMVTCEAEDINTLSTANACQERYWSPLEDGIQMLPSQAGKCPSREGVNSYMENVLYGQSTRKRLPAFTGFFREQ